MASLTARREQENKLSNDVSSTIETAAYNLDELVDYGFDASKINRAKEMLNQLL